MMNKEVLKRINEILSEEYQALEDKVFSAYLKLIDSLNSQGIPKVVLLRALTKCHIAQEVASNMSWDDIEEFNSETLKEFKRRYESAGEIIEE